MTVATTSAESQPQSTALGRDWKHLWGASTISTLGDGALLAALPLLAKSTTSDPQLIAWVATAATLPWLLLSLPGGAIIDRLDRRRMMIGAQAAQAILVGAIAVIATFGLTEIWMLYGLAFGLGTAEMLFTGAGQALVPSIVTPANLEAANGRQIAAMTVSKQFAGPPIGAALFAFALPLPFWLDMVTFVVSLALISRIRGGRRAPEAAAAITRRGMGAEIGEGLRWLARNRLPRTLTLIAAAGNFCEYMALSVLVLFADQVLGVSDAGYGVLLGAMAIGGVLGGVFSRRIVARYGGRRVAITIQVLIPLTWLTIGLFGRDAVTVVALFTVFYFVISLWNVMAMSMRQRLVPSELMGRVGGAGRMIAFGAIPLGSLCGGLIADSFGLIAPWIVGASIRLLASALAMPSLRRWDGPQ